MNFKVEEQKDKTKKYIFISKNASCVNELKKELKSGSDFELAFDYDTLGLGQTLYGANKEETKSIQKTNMKLVIKLYKICKRVVHVLKRKKSNADLVFYVENLDNKKNNNDLMIVAMLDVRFNYNPFKRMGRAAFWAGEYLDKENELNHMCDFKGNMCKSHRELSKSGKTGCCPSFCKYRSEKPCDKQCLACKIFMCRYLIERGYYFTPNLVPVLKINLTLFERLACNGFLFKTLKQTERRLWLVRILMTLYILLVLSIPFLVWL